MLRLRKPDVQFLGRASERHAALPLSYDAASVRGKAPGYVVDNYRVRLGSGAAVFERGKQALREWRMLRLGWVEPCWPDTQVRDQALVGTMAQVFGLWTVNVCRIVLVIDEDGPVSRYGFAYGTLMGHVECGEERFLVEWHRADDSVWYDIRAVSKPGCLLARLTYPLARRLQRRFGRDSLRAMSEAVGRPGSDQENT